MREVFVGIDVAFAKQKFLPIIICEWEGERLLPLPLRRMTSRLPPRGSGNAATLDDNILRAFAQDAVRYLTQLRDELGLDIRQIAIDSPKEPCREGAARREAELAIDRMKISCFATPSDTQLAQI